MPRIVSGLFGRSCLHAGRRQIDLPLPDDMIGQLAIEAQAPTPAQGQWLLAIKGWPEAK